MLTSALRASNVLLGFIRSVCVLLTCGACVAVSLAGCDQMIVVVAVGAALGSELVVAATAGATCVELEKEGASMKPAA